MRLKEVSWLDAAIQSYAMAIFDVSDVFSDMRIGTSTFPCEPEERVA
jgi:hypothetical protein